ncbi:efflux RND transporter periplasmic adaptor subunit [Lutibacter sp. B2]|nr:efflux RND transporter periplasmic adaptor subunit [Lutibacter sp. B2]
MKKHMIAMLLIGVLSISTGCGKEEVAQVVASTQKPVIVQKVQETEYYDEISASGNIQPEKTVKLAYKMPGIIQNVYVEEGQQVKQNTKIVSLDAYDYELNSKAATATWESAKLKMDSQVDSKINQAKANLDVIEKNYQRVKNLYEQGAMPAAQMDEIEAKYIAAKNLYKEAVDAKEYTSVELRKAEALRDVENEKLQNTTLYSPIDGIILKKINEAGETIAAGYPVVVVGQIDQVRTEIGVSDGDINKIHKGQKASVYVFGLEKEFEGIVSEVGALADTKTRIFPVKITINNNEFLLKPGMVAKVNIKLEKKKAILVPVDSIINMPQGPIVYVYSEKEGTVSERKIVSGEIIKDQVLVLEGIKAEEQIVTEGQFRINNNDKVNVEATK